MRPIYGLHTIDNPKAFAGRVRPRDIFGLNASEIRNNKCHCERTQRDIRLDGLDHCFAVFQVAGRSTIIQDDQAVALAVGDVAFVNCARPVTYLNDGHEQWITLQLPRQRLIRGLGFEPRGGVRGHSGTREVGISLRYLQKLFTNRGCTCSGFVQSVRLDQAART
ncbi:hypothetical protein, partial [Bradyrhizobium sp. Leo170]|uniref:AraC-like ligand-binding domain-containing protein n=1 Tax=Bradyrhizobium sp. Leo170 TaxID=1571199 RepID=UPI001A925A74